MTRDLARRIDALLPQTQCTQCGYDGCRPYADAIAAGGADIDQCPPGGDAGVVKLAELLGRNAAIKEGVAGSVIAAGAFVAMIVAPLAGAVAKVAVATLLVSSLASVTPLAAAPSTFTALWVLSMG